jgi:alkylhydroperoxidase family enzyme
MSWIKIIRPSSDTPELLDALQSQRGLFPEVYGAPRPEDSRLPDAVVNESIVLSHSLIPEALRHAFSAFGALMDPKLPLTRRDHELIAAVVSATNACFY